MSDLQAHLDGLVSLIPATTEPKDYRSVLAFLIGIVYNEERKLDEMDKRSAKLMNTFMRGGIQKIQLGVSTTDAGYALYRSLKLPFVEMAEILKKEKGLERDHLASVFGHAAKGIDSELSMWFMICAGIIRDDTAVPIFERCEFYFTHRELGRIAYPQLIPEDV